MTMCGLFIPAEDFSRVSVFDRVLADIGDEQSIQQNLSTFSSHMTNVAHILSVADDSSLVLIDELGAGTDPTEGAALAVSIIEALRSKGAKIAATTHYAELKAYALDTDGVINGCCEFDVDTLSPTYRLLIGVPGRSNAFAISLRIGIDEAVVNHAREIVSSENRDFEAILDKLENARLELEEEKKKAQKLTEKANRFAAKAQSEKDKINTLKERELDKAKQEAERLINQARRQSSEFLMELEKLKKRAIRKMPPKSQEKQGVPLKVEWARWMTLLIHRNCSIIGMRIINFPEPLCRATALSFVASARVRSWRLKTIMFSLSRECLRQGLRCPILF